MSDNLSRPPESPDSLDAVLAAAVSAPAMLPELAAGTVVAERYEIERVLGAGGMGTVYLARDRSLDRAIALKLHRVGARPERLRREALAMAKLSHPNVVTVFEVGAFEGHTFVAMEYVPGETLRVWARDRSWREILSALIVAGEGLAAVHAAGLVHRDVKPDNVLVGDDGRARIGDFGLARMAEESGESSLDAAGEERLSPLTKTGAVLGTPGYMAPEQFAAGRVDARADQFGFCAAAWEMLLGTRPFAGDSVDEVRRAVSRGDLQVGRTRVPPRVRRVLARGLSKELSARYASMDTLIAALRSAERRGRVLAMSALGLVGAAGVLTWALWPAADPMAACSVAGSEIDQILPSRTIADAAARLKGAPGLDAGPMLVRAGEQIRTDYRSLARKACEARVRGQWAPEIVAANRECLAYQTRTARALIGASAGEGLSPADVSQIVLQLPVLAPCGDARLLAGWASLADDPAALEPIVEARAALDAALTLMALGRLDAAREIHGSVAASPVAKQAAIAGRLDLLAALVQIAEHDYTGGEKRLADVYFASRARDDGELSLHAVRELIGNASDVRHDFEVSARWVRDGLAEADRNAARLPEAAASVYIAAASAASNAGDTATASKLAAHAEKLIDGQPSSHNRLALYSMRAEILMLDGKTDEALTANETYIAAQRASLGAGHPAVAIGLSQRAMILLEAGRAEQAAAAAREAYALVGDESMPSPTLAAIETNLGATLLAIDDPDAAKVLEHARQGWVAAYGEDHPDVALIDTNLALTYLDRGEIERALAALEHAVAVQERALGPTHPDLGATLYNLAVAQRDAMKLDTARATARRCEAIFREAQPGSMRDLNSAALLADIENRAKLPAEALATATRILEMKEVEDDPNGEAWVRLEAARALISLGQTPDRARKLLGEARTLYTTANLPARVAEVDKLLAKLR